MAPKRRGRRSKKVPRGGYRRDAALDAMREYGFEDELIETTVDELLEVYEGGWLFIEDSSYHVLREALLAKSNTTKETEQGNPVEERDFDLENGGAVIENEVGANATGNLERAITIHCSVGDSAPVGEASVVQSKNATAGDSVVSVEAEVERPIGCLTLTDTGAAGPSSIMVLPCSNMKATCEDGSSEIYAEPLSAVPGSKGNDANPFGDGVELQPSESSNEHVPDSKPAKDGESSGCKDMDLGEDDRNGSVDPRNSRQPLPAPLRQRRKRELKPCYGWLSDDESDDEDYKEHHHILQLEPASLSGNVQKSRQRKRVQLEQNKVVSSSDEVGPVGHIMDTSAVIPSGAILPVSDGSNASAELLATVPGPEGNDTKLSSFKGVELQCDNSPKPSDRSDLACPLPALDGESSGSEYADLEDDEEED